jgi:hypothetical protein
MVNCGCWLQCKMFGSNIIFIISSFFLSEYKFPFICPLQCDAVAVVIVWWLDLQLTMQSMPITTDVVGSNLDQGEVYNSM